MDRFSFPTTAVLPLASDQPVPSLINVSIGAIITSFSLVLVVAALVNAHYPPLKAKDPRLMAFALLGTISFWVGKLHAHGFLGFSGVLRDCTFWGVWLQLPFGACLVVAILSLRYQKLYEVLICHRSANSIRTYIPTIIYAIIVLSCSIAASAAPSTAGFYWDPARDSCFATSLVNIMFFGCLLIGMGSLSFLTWRLRNVPDAFNEYHETRYGVFLLLACLIVNVFLVATQYSQYHWAMHVIVASTVICTNAYIWLVMAPSVYGVIFDKEGCQRRFLEGLDPDARQYIEINSMRSTGAMSSAKLLPYTEYGARTSSLSSGHPARQRGQTGSRSPYYQADFRPGGGPRPPYRDHSNPGVRRPPPAVRVDHMTQGRPILALPTHQDQQPAGGTGQAGDAGLTPLGRRLSLADTKLSPLFPKK